MTDISRRKLFGAAGAASLGLAGMVPVASASECGKPVKWNETKEFVIIGTGFAGLAAALEAHQGGMKSAMLRVTSTPRKQRQSLMTRESASACPETALLLPGNHFCLQRRNKDD